MANETWLSGEQPKKLGNHSLAEHLYTIHMKHRWARPAVRWILSRVGAERRAQVRVEKAKTRETLWILWSILF